MLLCDFVLWFQMPVSFFFCCQACLFITNLNSNTLSNRIFMLIPTGSYSSSSQGLAFSVWHFSPSIFCLIVHGRPLRQLLPHPSSISSHRSFLRHRLWRGFSRTQTPYRTTSPYTHLIRRPLNLRPSPSPPLRSTQAFSSVVSVRHPGLSTHKRPRGRVGISPSLKIPHQMYRGSQSRRK